MNCYLKDILQQNRLLEVLYDNLPVTIKRSWLYNKIAYYLEEYSEQNIVSTEKAISIYNNFIYTFNKDCKEFNKSKKYPHELPHSTLNNYTRVEYDIILILSILFTKHRYRIMECIADVTHSASCGNALFIGVGPGIEIFLTQNHYKKTDAYDLSLCEFLNKKFPNVNFHNKLYNGQGKLAYDVIYLIELLEHIDNPFELLQNCYNSLKPNGNIILTTATNIPQFDHLYNFPEDHHYFERELINIGFKIIYKEKIEHDYLVMSNKSSNHFYTIQKI